MRKGKKEKKKKKKQTRDFGAEVIFLFLNRVRATTLYVCSNSLR